MKCRDLFGSADDETDELMIWRCIHYNYSLTNKSTISTIEFYMTIYPVVKYVDIWRKIDLTI